MSFHTLLSRPASFGIKLIGAVFPAVRHPCLLRAYTRFTSRLIPTRVSGGQLTITLIFGLAYRHVLACYGLTSLLRARRISRS